MFDSSILTQYGITNLIDIDGLLYAPVSDLWSFFQRFSFDALIAFLPLCFCVAFFFFWVGRLIGYLIKRYMKFKTQ